MNPALHALILASVAIAVFTAVMAYGWIGMVERRLQALESGDQSD